MNEKRSHPRVFPRPRPWWDACSWCQVLARLQSAVIVGIDAHLVSVEVDVSFGLPSFTIVGLPDASVRESRDRVRSAIRNSGFEFPPHRVTVNLAPADIRKAGSSFDLPIALGVLAAAGHVTRRDIAGILLLGELSLDGGIQAARGVLPIAAAASRHRCHSLLLPHPNRGEAAVVEGLTLYPVRSLAEAVAALNDPGTPMGCWHGATVLCAATGQPPDQTAEA